jgi:hypothetical protein
MKTVSDGFKLNTLLGINIRHLFGLHSKKQHTLVEHFVMFKILLERLRSPGRIAIHENGRTGDTRRRMESDIMKKLVQELCFRLNSLAENPPSFFPGRHHGEH